MPRRSPIVMRMKRCSMLARVRTAWRVISWEDIPYTMSLKTPRIPRFLFGVSLDGVEVIFLLLPEILPARHVALPGRDLRHHVRQEPERVHGRQHRHTDQIAHRHHHENRLHLVPHLQGVAGELVPRHPVEKLRERLAHPGHATGDRPAQRAHDTIIHAPRQRTPGERLLPRRAKTPATRKTASAYALAGAGLGAAAGCRR